MHKKARSHPNLLGREREYASWCHPNSEQTAPFVVSCYGERAVDVSVPAPPLSFRWAEQNTFSTVFLSVDRWSAYCCGIVAVYKLRFCNCMRFFRKSQAIGRLEAGFTMVRQSKSPRARPRTSISAVAILLAKGMLLWSHRREM